MFYLSLCIPNLFLRKSAGITSHQPGKTQILQTKWNVHYPDVLRIKGTDSSSGGAVLNLI